MEFLAGAVLGFLLGAAVVAVLLAIAQDGGAAEQARRERGRAEREKIDADATSKTVSITGLSDHDLADLAGRELPRKPSPR